MNIRQLKSEVDPIVNTNISKNKFDCLLEEFEEATDSYKNIK
jgi:hypothetical protein